MHCLWIPIIALVDLIQTDAEMGRLFSGERDKSVNPRLESHKHAHTQVAGVGVLTFECARHIVQD